MGNIYIDISPYDQYSRTIFCFTLVINSHSFNSFRYSIFNLQRQLNPPRAMKHSLIAGILAISGIASASNSTDPDEYDYIIIGSGPGGGPLAAGLAQLGASVLLMEAGGDHSDDVAQRLAARLQFAGENAPHSWQFFVEHYQNETQARRDSKYTYQFSNGSYYSGIDPPEGAKPHGVLYPRGATLGGSAQVNAMNGQWAPDNEWDYIANLTGDCTWGHESMRNYLVKLENATYVPQGTPGHGHDGFLQLLQASTFAELEFPNLASFYSNMVLEVEGSRPNGTEELRERLVRDINRIDNDRNNPSAYTPPLAANPTTVSRSGIAEYVNRVVEQGYPLTLSLHSLAKRIIFEECPESGEPRAVGVEYLEGEGLYSADNRYDPQQQGIEKSVRARKEVIVSGGTFNTPQILKLSGIGPAEELKEFDIPVVVDLPAVGNFMQDNYESGVHIRAEEPWIVPHPPTPSSPNCTRTYDDSDPCFVLWERNATGPYTQQIGAGYTGRSSVSWDADGDLVFLCQPGRQSTGFFPGYSNGTQNPFFFSTAVIKMQTANPAGTVKLQSKDPRIAPAINFNFFEHNAETDLQALSESVDMLLRSFDGTGVPYEVREPKPGMPVEQSIMDEAFSHHATSSCRMGADNATDTCVDSKFRVKGTKGLRIVDASVWPRVPGAYSNLPTFTMSMKAIDVIFNSV
ncbi:unnamed protein product [Periconia digitata]|uniref:Glucose-methanol-choline oxidoreductase N-terminal domain-containing protein n=1 Tax=Periconia digitata TaxID=1303443 RepID=A0A9W4UPU1_9PLEO|nr:unnamed protein product [Periconia digitata]